MAVDPVTAGLEIGGKLIDRLWPDPAQRDAARLKLLEMQQSGELAQLEVNKAEAQSSSVFVAGWRPFIGWVCGAACAWNWIGFPVAKFALSLADVHVSLTPADLSDMWPVLLGMLGLGALRTTEKIKGAA